MEYKSNNKTPKPIEKEEENKFCKLPPELEKLEKEWTVEDLMELCPSLTRKEAEIAHKMGW